jgi:hypothetical protein
MLTGLYLLSPTVKGTLDRAVGLATCFVLEGRISGVFSVSTNYKATYFVLVLVSVIVVVVVLIYFSGFLSHVVTLSDFYLNIHIRSECRNLLQST